MRYIVGSEIKINILFANKINFDPSYKNNKDLFKTAAAEGSNSKNRKP